MIDWQRWWQAPVWEGVALCLWGGLLLRARLRQELTLFIHQNYLGIATLSALLLLTLGGIQLIRYGILRQEVSGPPHPSLLPARVGAMILIVAALVGWGVVPRPLSSQTALNRGVDQNISLARESPEAFRPSVDPGSRGLIDWIRTLDVYPDPDNYIDQQVNVNGFVIPYADLVAAAPEGMNTGGSGAAQETGDLFWVARFLISCCAADAYPVGLPVIWPQASQLEADVWLEVKGTMVLDPRSGSRQLAIKAESITPISTPVNPYAY